MSIENKDKQSETSRLFARKVARELSLEEIKFVSGGHGNSVCGGTSMSDPRKIDDCEPH